MRSLLENQRAGQHEGAESAFERPARFALFACVSVMGIAVVYFMALYLLAR